ncbi:hypothetical protein [Paenibacillus helianthi]|uniref:hypothetical protein n=1 Tax=Paenibacillus helianthi TaxID=1349432 RepID=UPI00142D825C|nr:hypothetical protein [Paenibacillus helianthi]
MDRLESAVYEAGDYLIPLAEGAITSGHIVGEICGLLCGSVKGRSSGLENTLSKR